MCEHCQEPQRIVTPREQPAGEREPVLCEAINHEERDVERMLCPLVAVLRVEERLADSHVCGQHFAEVDQTRSGRGRQDPLDWRSITEMAVILFRLVTCPRRRRVHAL